jgi:GNAT superfamily N-acetyltransferase
LSVRITTIEKQHSTITQILQTRAPKKGLDATIAICWNVEMADEFMLRTMRGDERGKVAEVICASIREWYGAHGKAGRFPGGPESCLLFPEVYEDLDPGCCVVAEERKTGRLAGSCFYHPRETHVSLGIMNAHPDYFGRGVAKQLLQYVCDLADGQRKPLRLVSSAMNLDSFSLYTRAGFTARAVLHDFTGTVPAQGFSFACEGLSRVREARLADAPAMAALEQELSGIGRENDLRYFIENRRGIWHVSVIERAGSGGGIDGFLVSVKHPASNMLGPGAMRTEGDAAALILAELNRHPGGSPVWLVPATCGHLVQQMYAWGFRNCEIHLLQVRGEAAPLRGVTMPTFMPETG